MRRKPVVVAAGTRFARSGHPDDELFVINFNERVSYGLPSGTPVTSDREELHRALQRVTARGQTALFDALQESLRHLAHGTRQRKILVVLSDGGDNASSAGLFRPWRVCHRDRVAAGLACYAYRRRLGRLRSRARRIATAAA